MLPPAVLRHKEPARSKQNTPQCGYFGFQSTIVDSRGRWMPELVLLSMKLLAKQFLGTVLDMEVAQSGLAELFSLVLAQDRTGSKSTL